MTIQELNPLFYSIRCFFHLPDRTFGISESSGISRRRYHAAGRDLGGSGSDKFSGRHGAYSGGRAYRKLGALSAWKIRRE